jgi:hypothetical protein
LNYQTVNLSRKTGQNRPETALEPIYL